MAASAICSMISHLVPLNRYSLDSTSLMEVAIAMYESPAGLMLLAPGRL